MSMRLPVELANKLEQFADATGKSKSFVAIQAIQDFIEREAWQVQEILEAIQEADRGEFATDEEVQAVFDKWSR